MTASRTGRPPLASALVLAAVLLLFGAATFVAGLAVGGENAAPAAQASPSESAEPTVAVPTEAATPGPTPVLETISCAEPSEAFAVL